METLGGFALKGFGPAPPPLPPGRFAPGLACLPTQVRTEQSSSLPRDGGCGPRPLRRSSLEYVESSASSLLAGRGSSRARARSGVLKLALGSLVGGCSYVARRLFRCFREILHAEPKLDDEIPSPPSLIHRLSAKEKKHAS
jgi:hypothetical protein